MVSRTNDIVFNEILKRWYTLDWNTRVFNLADSKLWYLSPEQSQAFLDLEKSEEYQRSVINKEIDIINDNIWDITKDIKDIPLNIIDLGCWDGKKAMLFVSYLKDKKKIRYCPVDISWYMVEQAMKEFDKSWVKEIVKFQWNISDFENLSNISSILRSVDYKDNLFLLLGNTLWNFVADDLLYKIQNCMDDDDMLIVWNWLNNKNYEELLTSYNDDFVNKWLAKILTQLWIEEDNLQFGVWFRRSRLELYYSIKNDCTIKFLDKKIKFLSWDQIIVAFSYKYNQTDFEKHMKKYFTRVKMFLSDDKWYAVAMCQK